MNSFKIFILFLFVYIPSFAQSKYACDSSLFYTIINKQIRLIDKNHKKDKYLLYRKILKNNSTVNNSQNTFCDTISFLNEKKLLIRNGSLTSNQNESIITYTFSSICMNATYDECKLYVYTITGEWGGNESVYIYKKKRGSWRFVKKRVLSVFC